MNPSALSLRFKIVLIVALALSALGGVFVFFTIAANRETLRLHEANVSERLMAESEKVNKALQVVEQNAVDLSLAGGALYRAHAKDELARIALDDFQALPDALGGGVWFERFAFATNEERVCAYACRDKDGKLELKPEFANATYDYPSQEWYTQIAERTKGGARVGWSRIYLDALGTHELMVTVGAAIRDAQGKFVGMSTIDWGVKRLITHLCALGPTPGSFVTLVNRRYDRVIADTRLMKDVTANAPTMSIRDLGWFANVPTLSPGRIAVVRIPVDGRAFVSFGRQLDNGMEVLIQVPEPELMGAVKGRNLLILGIALVVFAVVLAVTLFVLTLNVNRPLKELMADVARLGGGCLEPMPEGHAPREILQLRHAFNRMIVDLKRHIENLRAATAANEKLQSELKVAQEIQEGILPMILPPFPKCESFEIDASLTPAKEVGGDLYDFFMLSPTRLCLVIGDVSGKGVPASLFMAVTQTLHRGFAHDGAVEPGALVANMNRSLCANNKAQMFVTYLFATVDFASGALTYCNAGHNPFFLLKPDGRVLEPCLRHGVPLGVVRKQSYGQSSLALDPGDTLFFYTDGVTEAQNARHQFFGVDRLKSVLADCARRRLAPRETDAAVRAAVAAFVAGADPFDDMTLLTIRVNVSRVHA